MSRREALLDEWRGRLAECERQLAEDLDSPQPSRWTWLRQMQARLLRFLLSRYGREDVPWLNAIDEGVPLPGREVLTPGQVVRDALAGIELSGVPPKSSDRIRATLAAIHDASEGGASAGPLQGARLDDAPILLTTFRHTFDNDGFCRLMRTHGIASQQRDYRGLPAIFVARRDSQRAQDLLADFQQRTKYWRDGRYLLIREPIRPLRASTWVLWGTAVATVIISLLCPAGLTQDVLFAAAFGTLLSVPVIHALHMGAKHDQNRKK